MLIFLTFPVSFVHSCPSVYITIVTPAWPFLVGCLVKIRVCVEKLLKLLPCSLSHHKSKKCEGMIRKKYCLGPDVIVLSEFATGPWLNIDTMSSSEVKGH